MGRTPECFRRGVRTTKIRRDIWPALLSEEAQLKMCPATPTEGALHPQQMCLASTIASYYVTVKFHIFISCQCYYDSSWSVDCSFSSFDGKPCWWGGWPSIEQLHGRCRCPAPVLAVAIVIVRWAHWVVIATRVIQTRLAPAGPAIIMPRLAHLLAPGIKDLPEADLLPNAEHAHACVT